MSPVKHRDPAPSVLRYRMSRLWLTPSFRRIVKFGPIVTIALGGVFYMATSASFHATMGQMVSDIRTSIVGREEFRVTAMQIHGASDALEAEVTRVANMTLPMSSLELDIVALRARIEGLPSVADAAVRVGTGGILKINLSERVPNVVWREGDTLRLLSADGVELGQIASRLDRADLPLVAGLGATEQIEEAMELFTIAAPIEDRVRGLQRVGQRRWNLVLDREQVIYLPEAGAKTALLRLMAIEATQEILGKDISIVDLRDAKKPVLRLGAFAASDLRPQKTGLTGDDQ